MLLAQGGQPLLLGHGVDVGADDERDQVEEGYPCVLGQELLRKGQAHGRRDPADTHDLPEPDADGSPHLMVRPGASYDSHGAQVNGVLNGGDLGTLSILDSSMSTAERACANTYDEVAKENLQDLGPQACAAFEDLLQNPDQQRAKRRTDKGAVRGHLWHARREVVAVLVAVLCQPRGEHLLSTGQCAGGQHLGTHWVLLELLDVRLRRGCHVSQCICSK